MLARSGTYHIDPEHFDEALAYFSTDVAQRYQASSGARGGLLLGNRKTGKLLGISFWEDVASMEASEEAAQGLREGVQQAGRGTDEIVREDWEILSLRAPEGDSP